MRPITITACQTCLDIETAVRRRDDNSSRLTGGHVLRSVELCREATFRLGTMV